MVSRLNDIFFFIFFSVFLVLKYLSDFLVLISILSYIV